MKSLEVRSAGIFAVLGIIVSSMLLVSSCGSNSSSTDTTYKYVAYGDSMTRGAGDYSAGVVTTDRCSEEFNGGYVPRLKNIVGEEIANEGICGESIFTGERRLRIVLERDHPTYIFILEGANDRGGSVEGIAAALCRMVEMAKRNNATPIIGTLPPVFDEYDDFAEWTNSMNEAIRKVAVDETVALADHAVAFNNDRSLIWRDGLHPNEDGYKVMADTWYNALLEAQAGVM